MAQNNKEVEILKRIELDSFSNRTAMEMGLRIIDLAKSRNQHIAIEISRLNHIVLFMWMMTFLLTNIIGLDAKPM